MTAARLRPDDLVVASRPVAPGARRWAIAAAIAILALGTTAAALLLAAGTAPVGRLAGWAPDGTVAYAELRTDPPSLQDPAVSRFLGRFPGLADPARLDEKVVELGDRLLERVTDGSLAYAPIRAWLGDAAAVAVAAPPTRDRAMPVVAILAVDDAAALRDWIAANVPAGGESATYRGVQLTTGTFRGDPGLAWAYAPLETVLLAGERRAVEAAIDAGGSGRYASSEPYRSAVAALDGPVVAFAVADGGGLIDGLASDPELPAAMRDAIRAATPAWIAAGWRVEEDGLVAEVVAPSPDGTPTTAATGDAPSLPPRTNAPSVLATRLPATTLGLAELHDAGPLLVALGGIAAAAESTTGTDADAGLKGLGALLPLLGRGDALVGWVDDAALVLLAGDDGPLGGVVASTDDPAAAAATLRQVRAIVELLAPAGTSLTESTIAGATVTTLSVADPVALARLLASATGGELPDALGEATAGTPAAITWTLAGDLLVIGSSTDFVAEVLAVDEAGSLASAAGYRDAIARVGAANAAAGYLDLRSLAGLLVPKLPADVRAGWERDLAPFADVLGAVAWASLAEEPMRVRFALTLR